MALARASGWVEALILGNAEPLGGRVRRRDRRRHRDGTSAGEKEARDGQRASRGARGRDAAFTLGAP